MSEMNEALSEQQPAKAPKKLWIKDKKKLFYYGLMLFPILQFCVFYIGVNFQSILLAFQKYENSKFVFATEDLLVNFKRIVEHFTEYDTLTVAFTNTLILWFFTAVCGTVLAILFSYYVFKRKSMGRFFRFILFLPSILPAILLSNVFKLFTTEILPIALGWEKILTGTDQAAKLTLIIFFTVWAGFGTQVLLYSNAMDQISPSIIEAAQLDGAKPMTEFLFILLPEIMPTVCTFLTATIAGAFMNQANLYNLYGEDASGQVYTVGYYLFIIVQPQTKRFGGRADYPFASALGLCCTAIAIPLTILFRKFSKRFED